MPSNTTRLGLRQIILDDIANGKTDFADNFDDIDAAVGSQVMAASARPSSAFSGKTIYDTTWKREQVWDGTAWRNISVSIAASSASITPTHQGDLLVQTSDNTLKVATAASAWTSLVIPASTIVGQGAMYTRNATQSTANNTDVDIDFDTAIKETPFITKSTSSGSVFTINVTGWYNITAQARWVDNNTGRRDLHITNAANTNERWATNRVSATQNGATGTGTGEPHCSVNVYLTAGQTVRIRTNQNSGGSLNLEAAAFGPRSRVTFMYMGS